MAELCDDSFNQIKYLLEKLTGIQLAEHKRMAVMNRLLSRLNHLNLSTFEEYLVYLNQPDTQSEVQIFIDKLTTHETYFYRENDQFNWLEAYLCSRVKNEHALSVWSAACSTGEEAYSLAMLLHNLLGENGWNVFGTDISQLAIKQAQAATYPMERVERIPSDFRLRYCLKGVGKYEGVFTLSKEIKQRCFFSTASLLEFSDSQISLHDIIFLRNILIYFSPLKQKQILQNVIARLQLGGLLFLGHSENIVKNDKQLQQVERCIFKKVSL